MARIALLFVIILGFFIAPAWAEKKVALIIGNSNYKHAIPLPNPSRDAQAMARMLEKLGFTVIAGIDLDRQSMADKMREFADKAENADTVLYFYAGHGIQLNGQNYLIPIDADLVNEMDVKLSTLDIDLMLQQTPVTARVKMVLLDACRDNPFKEQIARSLGKTRSAAVGSGLAEMKPTFGTMIAYATGPGEVALDGDGHNSPFTTALLKYLPEQGLEIGQAMTRVRAAVYKDTGNRQLPWENKNLTSDYYLVPVPEAAKETSGMAAIAAEPAAPLATAKAEGSWTAENGDVILWQAVKDSSDPAEIQVYLDRYGETGIFANTARKRIEALSAVAAASPATPVEEPQPALKPTLQADSAIATASASSVTEEALRLGKTDKKILLIKLSAMGFASRSLAAEFDANTRLALARWQEARGYPVTGFLNKLQYDALLLDDTEEPATPTALAPVEPLPEVIVDPTPPVIPETPRKRAVAPYKAIKEKPPVVTHAPVVVKPKYKAKVVEPKVVAPPKKKVVKAPAPKPKAVAVAKKKRGPVVMPKIGISINSGGGVGLSLGF